MQVFTSLMKRNIEWYQRSNKNVVVVADDAVGAVGDDDLEAIVALNNSPAEIQSIMANDITAVSETITTTVANLIRSCCSVVFATRNMLQIDPNLLSISIGIVPVIGSAAVILNKFVKKIVKKQRDLTLESEAFASERIENIDMVKISSREDCEVERYINMQEQVVRLGKLASWAKGVFMGFMFSASSAALVMVFHVGGKDVAKGKLTHGELKSFATYSFMLGLGTSGVIKGIGKMMQGMVCADRVYGLLDGTNNDGNACHGVDASEEEKATSNQVAEKLQVNHVHAISIDHVSFSYVSNVTKEVLKDITLDIERGQVVALVGANGAGKSTLANILVALHKPTSGSIVAKLEQEGGGGDGGGDLDLFSLNRKEQSALVQLVPQHPAFFNMSIRENVTYTNPSASQEEIAKALEDSNCTAFVSKLDGGLDYIVGRNGCKLSGGQRQRLALARALLSDPALLILDEPNSAMDAEGESAVSDIVHACRKEGGGGATATTKKRGLLLISHRAATLHLADKIAVMKDGALVEIGSYEDLSRDSSSELCQLMPDLQ
jgi:ABC-type multidrug transport system fused ATPase/permease subunit